MQQNQTSADQSSLKDFSKEVLPYEEMVIRDSYNSAQSLTKLSK